MLDGLDVVSGLLNIWSLHNKFWIYLNLNGVAFHCFICGMIQVSPCPNITLLERLDSHFIPSSLGPRFPHGGCILKLYFHCYGSVFPFQINKSK